MDIKIQSSSHQGEQDSTFQLLRFRPCKRLILLVLHRKMIQGVGNEPVLGSPLKEPTGHCFRGFQLIPCLLHQGKGERGAIRLQAFQHGQADTSQLFSFFFSDTAPSRALIS